MGLVATWLSGCGLSHAVPNFTAAGIVTPAALAELDLAHYEALGVKSADDRRKLFYLVQRIKLAVDKDKQKNDNKSQTTSIEEQVEKMVSSTSMETADEEKDEQAHGEASIEGISPKKSSSSSPVSGTSPKPRRSPSKIQQPKAQSPKMASSTNSSKTSPGETTTLISSPEKTKTDTSSKEPQNMAESSTWEDEEEDDNADDEASEVVASPVRRSNRIASKGNTNNSSAAPRTATNTRHGTRSATSATTRSANTATSTTSKTSASSRVKAPLTKAKSINNMPNPKKGFSSKSGATAGAFPRTNSKLQNPSKSLRTGKQLSTIPSDSIAAMSPLPAAKLQELPEENKTTVKQDLTSRLGGKTRHSHGGRSVSDSGSDTESKASSRSSKARSRRSVDGSSSRTIIGRVSYDSDSSANSSTSRRRSSIAAPKTESKTASTRRTSGVGTGIGQRRTVPSASSTSSQSKTVKSAVSIHGGTDAEDSSWKAQINSRRQEVNVEHELFCSDDLFHDDDDENDMQIRVAIRKRPFNADKPSDIDVLHPLEYGSFGKMLVFQPKTRVDLTKEVETVPFAFDTVFGEQYNNADIYRKSVCNLIPYVLEGSQCCCFAFGCTGSGKTFTMMGKGGGTRGDAIEEKNMGLYYMAALDIFRSLEEFEEYSHLSVGVSLFEIYGGKLFDLLNDRKPVKCLEDHKGKVQFPGLSEHCIEGPGDLMEMIELGASARSTGSTSRNAHSSRSHAVLQLHLRKDVGRKQNVEHGRLTFIDLAGSERGADTANCSRATRLEGAEINQSLLALKEVIRARARGGSMNHVPFRGSKLTQVLKESFTGENSRCLMIACASGEQENCEQTLNTLRYANRVKERNAESGALPAKLAAKKTGGRRGRSSIYKSSASMSSIVSTSDQSFQASYDKRTKNIGVHRGNRYEDTQTSQGEDSFSDTRSNSAKESEAMTKSKPKKDVSALPNIQSESFDDDLLDAALNEDDPEALLASALSDDSPEALLSGTMSEDSRPASDSQSAQSNSLVDELVETHQSFLSAVLGMVQDEIVLLDNLKVDKEGFDNHKNQLEGMQQNQSCLISDLRECFSTYTSIQEKFPDFQLKTHGTVLTALLDILKDQMALTESLEVQSNAFDDTIGRLDVLLQDKLLQISELSECFQSKDATPEDSRIHSKVMVESQDLLQESFRVGKDDGNVSDDSFEDLRN